MTVLDQPRIADARGPDSPEQLIPEARRRRRRRWLVTGSLLVLTTGLFIGLRLVATGNRVRPSPTFQSAADRLAAAIRATQASGTAVVETTQRTSSFSPPGTAPAQNGSVALVRFKGDVAAVWYWAPNTTPQAEPSYFFGDTFYSQPPDMQGQISPSTPYIENPTAPANPFGPSPFKPFGPLRTASGQFSLVTELSRSGVGNSHLTEYRVREPSTVNITPLGPVHQWATTLYVWVDTEGRIVRILAPQMVYALKGGVVATSGTIPPASQSTPATSRTTIPSVPHRTVRIQSSVTSTYEEVTLSHFGVAFNPSVPSTSP